MDGPGLAAVAVWPVHVNAGPVQATIAALPAYRWIVAIRDRHNLLGVVPGLVDDDGFLDQVAVGAVTAGQCQAAARHAVGAASGKRWWVAERLVVLSTEVPWVAGALVLAGVDAARVSLGAWCAATWQAIVDGRDPKDVKKIEFELCTVPDGVPVEDLYDSRVAAAAFDGVVVAD